jgi:hypothetical protein
VETLQTVFQKKGIANKVLLKRQLQQMRFDPNLETMSEYLLRMNKLTRHLREAGVTIDEDSAMQFFVFVYGQHILTAKKFTEPVTLHILYSNILLIFVQLDFGTFYTDTLKFYVQQTYLQILEEDRILNMLL